MQPPEYEKALLAMAVWRLAVSDDVNELMAIACTVRNWVAQHGPMADGRPRYSTYTEAIENFLRLYPLRGYPAITAPALVDPREGLLAQVDGVYDCTLPDFTSSRIFPMGARYFARVARLAAPDWFVKEILLRQDVHPLIGTFGSQQFYA